MARTLETLEPGTPVFCGDQRVGEVRATYAEGNARAVEWVIVQWTSPPREVAVPATEVQSLNAEGMVLMHQDPHFYNELASFSEARFPTVRRLT